MLNIRDMRIDPTCLGQKKLLVDIVPVYEYRDNKRTDVVVAYRYIVALPELRLEKLGVKIKGRQLMEKPEGFAEVEFDGLEVSAYESQGHTQITAMVGRSYSASLLKVSWMYFLSSRYRSPTRVVMPFRFAPEMKLRPAPVRIRPSTSRS